MYVKDLNTTARMHLDSVLADGYTVDDYGIITDPGKFEGEHFSAILFWQMGLEGFADVDTSDEFQNFYEFHMTPAELADYGLDYGFGTKPLNGQFFYVMLSESDSGFVSLNMQQFSDDDSDDEDDDSPDNDDAPAMTDQEYEQAARAEFITDQYNELRAELVTDSPNDDSNHMESWYASIGAQYAPVMNDSEYQVLRARYDAESAWLQENVWSKGKNSYFPGDMPEGLHLSNEERTAIEVYEWLHDKPQKYFLYVRGKTGLATTWTGNVLGRVVFRNIWESNKGDTRQAIHVLGTNGVAYYGIFYRSAGDYARITANKDQERALRQLRYWLGM